LDHATTAITIAGQTTISGTRQDGIRRESGWRPIAQRQHDRHDLEPHSAREEVAGAIGGTEAQDQEVAEAGIAAF
jgi:hypothetical protein